MATLRSGFERPRHRPTIVGEDLANGQFFIDLSVPLRRIRGGVGSDLGPLREQP
jgi:hypothetical protein